MEVIKMKEKKSGRIVDVYGFRNNKAGKLVAVVFDLVKYRDYGSGWDQILLKNLVPIDVPSREDITTKTEVNRIKARLKIHTATWQATDGKLFDHKNMDEAIEYERQPMKQEEKDNVNC